MSLLWWMTRWRKLRFKRLSAPFLQRMEQVGIRCAVGISWRAGRCSVKEQLEEADQRMYQEKRRFYSVEGNDRRKRREGGQQEHISG